MKKITLLIFLMLYALGFSQNAPITFETGEQGSTWSFASFENSTGIGYEKVANPFATGINTSATVGKFTAVVAGQPWAGCESAHASGVNGIGTFTFSLSNCIVKVWVYKPVISDVGLKFAEASGDAQPEVKVKNTKINEWEELTFDMSGSIGKGATGIIDQIIIFPDFQARTTENVCYFDNITFSAKTTTIPAGTGPTAAAPAPPARNATDVKSVFSNAYTDIAGTSWTPNWGQSTISEEVSVAGDAVKKFSNLNYQGVVPAAPIDTSGMNKLHLDVWTADCTAFDVYLINPGPTEQKVTLTPTLSGWNSFDINLSDYTNIALNNVFQFKFVSPNQNSTVYLDNMYFYKSGTVLTPTPTATPYAPVTFETSEYGSTWSFASFENSTGIGYEKVANPFATGINTSATVGKFTAVVAGQPWAGCESAHASGVNGIGTFTFSLSNCIVKVWVYKPVISDVGLKFAEASGDAQPEVKVKNTKINEWEELTFDMSGSIGKGATGIIDQIIIFPDFQARTTENVCYFDNITFSAKTTTTPPTVTAPTVAAPTPAVRPATDVISLFSGAYTDLAGTDWAPGWGQSTAQSEVAIVGDATKKFTNLNYQGVVPSAAIDASGMTKLHLDVWTADCTAFDVYLINPGPTEQKVTLKPTLSGWNSFDINLSDYTNIALNNVFQFKFVSPNQNSTVYLDNMYFYKSAVTTPVVGVSLPLDFETQTLDINDFGNDGTGKATMAIVANTQTTGNTSAKVLQIVKNGGQTWAGNWFPLSAPIDFTQGKFIKALVYSPKVGGKILLKLENSTDPSISMEKEVLTTVAGAWETLTFDYSAIDLTSGKTYQKMVMIVDNGTVGTGANFTYLIDNMVQSQTGTSGPTLAQMNLPLTFDDTTVDYGLIGFGGADVSTIAVDPTLSTNKVAKVIKSATAETWAGTTISAAAALGFSSKIPFTATETKMNVRVWSPNAGIVVRLKLEEHGDNTHTVETEATVTTASGWETLEFNFANQATGTEALHLNYNYDKASIFFNFGTAGAIAGEKTYYFDDLKFGAKSVGTATGATLPLDFESSSYTFVDFDGGVATKIANPKQNGINTSANVAQMVKGAGQPWGGSKIKMASPVDFSTKKIFKVKVLSPVAGKKLLLKFEKADGTGGFEKESTGVTTANTWEELSFDFTGVSGVSNLADNMVFIFDLGTTGDGSANSTYLFDDITQSVAIGGGSTLTQMKLPVSFDDATVDYGLIGFGGADASSVVVDPTSSANKVAKVVKSATAESWAGTTVSAAAGLGFSSAIPFTATDTKMSVRIWSPDAGTIVRLKVEEHGDNTHTVETETAVTTGKGWETLEFDFAKPVSGTSALNLAYKYDKATIFFGFGTTGLTTGEKIYYFDDVAMAKIVTKPVLDYGFAVVTYPVGKPIYPLTLTNSGGIVPSNGYSISPVLPEGLIFDTNTAKISGTPTVMSQANTYTITGSNVSGSSSTTVSIEVNRDFKSNNFTIETIGETCLGENNGELIIKAAEAHTYIAVVNDKSYEFSTNSLRVYDLAPGIYTISISVKGETFAQSFSAAVSKGKTITGKSVVVFNKVTVEMTEGTGPFKVYLDGEEQFETPFATFSVDMSKNGLLEVKTTKICEGTYTKKIDGILESSAVSPNPTSGSFEIAIPTSRKEVVIDLYSLSSMFISSKTYPLENGIVKLSLDGQTEGIYIAKVYLDAPAYLKIIKK